MEINIHKPHDHFVRYCMGHLDLARAFFRFFLNGEVSETIDLGGLATTGENYVNKELKEIMTDMVYTAPYLQNQAAICLLVEHKSRDSGDIPAVFQMRNQEVFVMDRFYGNNKTYPCVVLICFYHGERSFNGPMSVAEKMDAPPHLIPERWKEKMNLIDLNQYSDELLMRQGKLGAFLMVLKHIFDKDVIETVKKLIPMLQEVDAARDGWEFLKAVLAYLVAGTQGKIVANLNEIAVQSFGEQVGGIVMETNSRLWAETQKAEKRGEKKKTEEFALKLIDDCVDTETIIRYTELSLDDIERLKATRRPLAG